MRQGDRKWYLLAYDIRDPRRLQRTYNFVRKHGIGLQKSVFLIRADREALANLKAGIRERVNARQDDVRLYPIRHPGVLWVAGQQQARVSALYAPTPREEGKPSTLRDRIRHLFSRGAK